MPDHPKHTPPPIPPAIDLSEITEGTRRALYDAVAAIHFNPSPEASFRFVGKARKLAAELAPTLLHGLPPPDQDGLIERYGKEAS